MVQLENAPQDLSASATLIYQINLTSLKRLSVIISSIVFTEIIPNAKMLIKIQGPDSAYCEDEDSSKVQFCLASKTSKRRGPKSRRPHQRSSLAKKNKQLVQSSAPVFPCIMVRTKHHTGKASVR